MQTILIDDLLEEIEATIAKLTDIKETVGEGHNVDEVQESFLRQIGLVK